MEYLLIGDIAKELDIPENTLRRYAKVFPEFMITLKTGRITKYHPDMALIFMQIRDLFDNKKTEDEIRENLLKEQPFTISDGKESQGVQIVTQQMHLELLGSVANTLDRISSQDEQIKRLSERVAELEQERVLEQRDKELLDQIRSKMKKPWYKKIFS